MNWTRSFGNSGFGDFFGGDEKANGLGVVGGLVDLTRSTAKGLLFESGLCLEGEETLTTCVKLKGFGVVMTLFFGGCVVEGKDSFISFEAFEILTFLGDNAISSVFN
mmetsp:Transcript_1607/g.1925  ORF Transcript_1607/g.1925 Transcript_1607/m.1925 type:complete len:107 (-) Transcript_1607:400-720(-)